MAVVRGRSMLPTLRPGDRLLVSYAGRPRRGELAVVRWRPGVVAVKRLALTDEQGYWFASDNVAEGSDSFTAGRPVAPGDVLAVVLARLWPRPRWWGGVRRVRD